MLEALAADPAAEAIAPAPLTPAGVSELVEAELGEAPDAAFAEACHRATGGLPFLVRQLVTRLREDGVAPTAAAAPLVGRFGGSAVGRWTLVRLGRLPPAAGRLARALAVHEAADLARVAALAGLDPG